MLFSQFGKSILDVSDTNGIKTKYQIKLTGEIIAINIIKTSQNKSKVMPKFLFCLNIKAPSISIIISNIDMIFLVIFLIILPPLPRRKLRYHKKRQIVLRQPFVYFQKLLPLCFFL